MAHKRMFSKDITGSDAFRDMPSSSQALYFHLGMEADDDGFLDSYKGLARSIGASEDDLKILISKRFLILFPSKILVIKHWLINNTIRKDRYSETKYLDEKRALVVKENGSYTEHLTSGNQVATKWQPSREEKRIEEDRREEDSTANAGDGVNEFINLFKEINPSYQLFFARPPQRAAVERLLKLHDIEWWKQFFPAYKQALDTDRYCPRATSPIKLEEKLGDIEHYGKSRKFSDKGNNFII